MKSINDLLSEHSFFKDFDAKTVEYISSCGKNMHFLPGEYLGREGEPADHFYVIRKGKVALEAHHPVKGGLIISTLGENDITGFSWIMPPHTFEFDLRAIDHTSVVAIDGKCLRGKIEKDPVLGYQLMKTFATIMRKRLRDTRMQFIDIYGTSR
jgi:CRP-like cAMP-binding protein